MAMPTVAAARAGASLMPSPTMATGPCALRARNLAQLVLGQQARLHVQPERPGDRLRGPGIVAGQHDRAHSHGQQRPDARRCIGPRFVAHGDAGRVGFPSTARRPPSCPRPPRPRQPGRLRRQTVPDPRRSVGEPTLTRLPPTTASTALPGDRERLLRGPQRNAVRGGPVQDGAPQRMAGTVLHGGGQRQHGPLGPVQNEHVRHARPPLGQGACLVEGDCADPAHRLQGAAALDEQAAPRARRPGRTRWQQAWREPGRRGRPPAGAPARGRST